MWGSKGTVHQSTNKIIIIIFFLKKRIKIIERETFNRNQNIPLLKRPINIEFSNQIMKRSRLLFSFLFHGGQDRKLYLKNYE